jgi:menaquinone-dependent protoporphyrinogen oxidase
MKHGKKPYERSRSVMKTLIAYTTKYGSVSKCAGILKDKISGNVQVVNVKTDQVPDLGGFDTIILGGSIYVGKIQKEMRKFCEENLDALLSRKVGLYICAGEQGDKKFEQLKNAFPEALYSHAAVKEIFGDELYYEKLNIIEKLAVRMLKGTKKSYSHLSMETIDRFAKEITK